MAAFANTKMEQQLLTAKKPKVRYALLDELRGFMVFCMIFYHAFFTVYDFFELPISAELFEFFSPAEPFFAGGFIFLSGLMCGFSRSNTKRGLLTCGVALLVTACTVLVDRLTGQEVAIYFGILHLLGFGMFFCGLFDFALRRVNKWLGLGVSLALFALLYGVPENNFNFLNIRAHLPAGWGRLPGMFILGFTTDEFYSADYFPLLPWLFLFLAGYYAVKTGFIQRFKGLFGPLRVKPLAFLGRHALWVYLLHQPVILAVCFAVSACLKR